jgi:threonine synthase
MGLIKRKETIAEGIAIAKPVRGRQILEGVRETGGKLTSLNPPFLLRLQD